MSVTLVEHVRDAVIEHFTTEGREGMELTIFMDSDSDGLVLVDPETFEIAVINVKEGKVTT